jgi:hypothetical protein
MQLPHNAQLWQSMQVVQTLHLLQLVSEFEFLQKQHPKQLVQPLQLKHRVLVSFSASYFGFDFIKFLSNPFPLYSGFSLQKRLKLAKFLKILVSFVMFN